MPAAEPNIVAENRQRACSVGVEHRVKARRVTSSDAYIRITCINDARVTNGDGASRGGRGVQRSIPDSKCHHLGDTVPALLQHSISEAQADMHVRGMLRQTH